MFVKVYHLMFYREPRLTQACVAKYNLWVFCWRPCCSRACCGRSVHRSGVERRTVCGVKQGTNNSRVAGGSWRCSEYTPHRYTLYDGKHSVGYCMSESVQFHNVIMLNWLNQFLIFIRANCNQIIWTTLSGILFEYNVKNALVCLLIIFG